MIDHLSTYATDFAATKRFYDQVLPRLGYGLVMEMVTEWDPSWPTRHMAAYGPDKRPVLWVIESKEKHTPRHVAFSAKDKAAVDAFYQAALAAGGKDNGPPGPRPQYHEHYYGCFVLDPDGNNLEAVTHRA